MNKCEEFMNLEDLDIDLGKLGKAASVLPDFTEYETYLDLNERILYLDFDINDALVDYSRRIIRWNRQDRDIPIEERKPIKLLINSYGGSLDSCLHFIDTLLLSKTPIYTYNVGVAMSAGFYIMLAGSKRFAYPNAQFLIHSGSGGAAGTYEQSKSQMEHYTRCIELLKKYVLERTTIPEKTYNKKRSTEWFIWAKDAIDMGIIDGLITSLDEI